MSPDDKDCYVHPYTMMAVEELENGFIIWRRATGDNVELLHIKTYVKGMGTGKLLICKMLYELLEDPPFATVFGFTRLSNTDAQRFYTTMGFDLSIVRGVYADGHAVLFSQSYDKLKELHNVRN